MTAARRAPGGACEADGTFSDLQQCLPITWWEILVLRLAIQPNVITYVHILGGWEVLMLRPAIQPNVITYIYPSVSGRC